MIGEGWYAYRLIDSGHGRKFEQFGPHGFIRPEPQAMWAPRLAEWDAAGEFLPGADEDGGGRWNLTRELPQGGWPLGWDDVRFTAQPTPFRSEEHTSELQAIMRISYAVFCLKKKHLRTNLA